MPKNARKATPAPEPTSPIQQQIELHDTAANLLQGDASAEASAAAAAYWTGYPLFVEAIEGSKRAIAGPLERMKAHDRAMKALDRTHWRAVRYLMTLAEALDLDSAALYRSGDVCRMIFSMPLSQPGAICPDLFGQGTWDTWPACLGRELSKLDPAAQKDIRDGEAVFQKLTLQLAKPRRVSRGKEEEKRGKANLQWRWKADGFRLNGVWCPLSGYRLELLKAFVKAEPLDHVLTHPQIENACGGSCRPHASISELNTALMQLWGLRLKPITPIRSQKAYRFSPPSQFPTSVETP